MSRALRIDREEVRMAILKKSACCPNPVPSPLGGAGGGHPVGNLVPDPTTGVSHQRSPYRWKSLWNENTGGAQLKYIRYANEFVGTLFDDQGIEPIDAFGSGTNLEYCSYNNIPFNGQNFEEQPEPYYNGCYGIPYIYFPARPAGLATGSSEPVEGNYGSLVSIHPNPASNEIWISSLVNQIKKVAVTTLAGRELMVEELGALPTYSCRLSVSDVASGVYSLRVYLADGQCEMHKLVMVK